MVHLNSLVAKACQNIYSSRVLIIIIPITLSAFTHLWNLEGFPGIYRDEDHYLRKTMHVLQGLGPQEGPNELISYPIHPYTHPYFGQLFLAGVLGMIGYPNSIHPVANPSSIQELFLVPRVLMGILAVADTFLLFRITEIRYNRTVALIASILFAVMPLTWMLRRVWLEPIQLPFVLSSILLALYCTNYNSRKNHAAVLVTISGILLGLAIFTKIPVFMMIPLVGYIVYSTTKNQKLLGLWLIPVLLIPSAWPLYAISAGQFDQWIDGVFWQSERENSGLGIAIGKLFAIDPVFMILSLGGFIYATLLKRRDILLLLWIVPFIVFNLLSGYVSYWHLAPLLPAFCISSALLIAETSKLSHNWKIAKVLPYAILSSVGVFGLIITSMLITLNLTSFHYQVISVLVNQLQDNGTIRNVDNAGISNSLAGNKTNNEGMTVLGSNYWLWLPKYVFDKNQINDYKNYYNDGDINTKNNLLVVGENFINEMTRDNYTEQNIEGLRTLYVNSSALATVEEDPRMIPNRDKYPFNSLIDLDPKASTKIEIRINH
jgi:hypothetical protein